MQSSVEPQRAAGVYAKGAFFGLTAVSIWAGWIVVARLGLRTSLAPEDITAIRFAVAGLILLPYLLRHGLALDRLGWSGVVLIAIGGGAPIVLLANVGLTFAPAAHAGALFPGAMPLLVALIAVPVLGETFSALRRVGLMLILAGVVGLLLAAGLTVGTRQTAGDAMFLGAALLWAVYTVCLRKAAISGLHAAAIAAVASLVVYLPIYVLLHGDRLLGAPLGDIALQALVQGVLTAVVSLILYGRAVKILGASSGAAFAAICPVLTALFGIALLDEMPTQARWTVAAMATFAARRFRRRPQRVTAQAAEITLAPAADASFGSLPHGHRSAESVGPSQRTSGQFFERAPHETTNPAWTRHRHNDQGKAEPSETGTDSGS